MSREENARYLESIRQRNAIAPFKRWMKWWPFLIVAYAAMYFMFSGGKLPGLPSSEDLSRTGYTLLVGVGVFAGALGFVFWRGQSARRKSREAFLHPDPSALLAIYEQVFAASSQFPDVACYRANSRALALGFYGDAASARRELASIDWAGRPPVIRAMERAGEATLLMLCEDEPERGLVLAKEALAMVEFPSPVAGSAQGRAYFEVGVAIGEVLTGTATAASLQVLEQHHQKTQLAMVRLLSVWGLRVAHTRAGNTARAEAMRELLQREAPHCAPLHRIPG
ncbi:hypothetical protein ACN469_01595 [Corallococcus terminator]